MRYVLKLMIGCCVAMTGCTKENMDEPSPQQSEQAIVDNRTVSEPRKLMKWTDLTSRPLPSPDHIISFGDDPSNVADLWVPQGAGPHPVVIMIHGGCWQKSIADRTLMNYAADELKNSGLAVWNIEYRGVDEVGGGYPGTFLDVARAADWLKTSSAEYNLDINKIGVFGHSAGGHLGVWLTGRNNVAPNSPLASSSPIRIDIVINSGGLADLEASKPVTLDTCLANIYDKLTGAPSKERPNVLSDTSPSEMLPLSAKVINVNGLDDGIAPPVLGKEFARKITASGGEGSNVIVANTGHVELISPGTEAFVTQIVLLHEGLD